MTELEALREEARAWVAANFPTELAGRAPIMGQRDPEDLDAFETWKARLCARGWGVPTWPTEYGGGG
ncbi:MAG: hypothetical protein B7Z13_09025, partial [Caulobacterales bacterium 32-67-6]